MVSTDAEGFPAGACARMCESSNADGNANYIDDASGQEYRFCVSMAVDRRFNGYYCPEDCGGLSCSEIPIWSGCAWDRSG